MQRVIIWNITDTAVYVVEVFFDRRYIFIVGHFSIRRSFGCVGKTNNSLMDAGAGRPLSTPEWSGAASYITESRSRVGPDSTAGRPVRQLMKIHLLTESRLIHSASISEGRYETIRSPSRRLVSTALLRELIFCFRTIPVENWILG